MFLLITVFRRFYVRYGAREQLPLSQHCGLSALDVKFCTTGCTKPVALQHLSAHKVDGTLYTSEKVNKLLKSRYSNKLLISGIRQGHHVGQTSSNECSR